MTALNLIDSYNYWLVALSVLIAIFASYAALDLAGRVTATIGWTRAIWLLAGRLLWAPAFGPCTTLECWRLSCQFPSPTIGPPFCCHCLRRFSLRPLRCTW